MICTRFFKVKTTLTDRSKLPTMGNLYSSYWVSFPSAADVSKSARMSEWFASLPPQWKTEKWIDDFQPSPQCPMWVLELIGFVKKKRDLQGTFVWERMRNIKKRAHKRRTEPISTGPPWSLRMSYSLHVLWLRAKSVAGKWLHLDLSFLPKWSLVLPH